MAKANKITGKIDRRTFGAAWESTQEFELSEDEEAIAVLLKTEDTGMIIGYHGETLEALQLILALVLAKERGEFKRVSLEVGDYKKNRDGMAGKAGPGYKRKSLIRGKKYIFRN